MKKKLFVIGLFTLSTILYSMPIKFDLHYDIKLVSDKNLYSVVGKGDLTNKELIEYTKKENIYVAMLDNGYYSIDSNDYKNNLIIGRFYFNVFTKLQTSDYEILDVKIINGDREFNLFEYIYRYYPYEAPLKTEFSPYQINSKYMISRYFVGFFKIPAKNKDKIKFVVKIKSQDEEFIFVYRYIVKQSKNFFTWLQ